MSHPVITVFFDGACPLCRREISLLQRLDQSRGALTFEDVSPEGAAISCPIDQGTLLARFHVKLPDGTIVDGARAFAEVWATVPRLGWLRHLGRFGPTRVVMDGGYRAFLAVRPLFQRWAGGRATLAD